MYVHYPFFMMDPVDDDIVNDLNFHAFILLAICPHACLFTVHMEHWYVRYVKLNFLIPKTAYFKLQAEMRRGNREWPSGYIGQQ